MRYSIEPRERRYVKGYGFLSFARNFGNKYGNRGGSRAAATSKMERFVIIVNG